MSGNDSENAVKTSVAMEGMIYNANNVLDQALSPDTEGIPRGVFQNCKGIVLLSVIEAGFILSGNVGTGVIIAHNTTTNTATNTTTESWSPPVALALGGIGCGIVAGAEKKDLILFAMDEVTFDAISGDIQYKIGGQASATAGPMGREEEIILANVAGKTMGRTFSYVFSKGVFGGMSVESAILSVRAKENEAFYGSSSESVGEVNTKDILEGRVDFPKGKGIEELHRKLDLLRAGKVVVPAVAAS
mmetsp:Transcript_12996/g.27607  ORF Transcript_12996/g.27607 Transcript_12996/m.27607 type:complete len:246 (+) Transcript_12996:108-845(+)